MQAVAFYQCDGKKLSGKVGEMREQLTELLPAGASRTIAFPEYETQDDFTTGAAEAMECDSTDRGSDTDATCIEYDLNYAELRVGTCVEVYWTGENQWYVGEITGLEETESHQQFEVHYESDGQKWWHDYTEFKCRHAT